MQVIPHGVDAERFPHVRRQWPPPRGRPVRLLSVGHAAPHKDQALLVSLVALLCEQGLDVKLKLTIERADSPVYVDGIQQQRQQLGLEDRVQLVGRVKEVERLYREADIMVFPSLSESFGFPIVEAMASGIPVVASGIAASEEVLGRDGWFFPPGDVGAAAAAVRRLLETPAGEVARITEHASQAARAFSWSANAARVAAAIEGVVRER
jgi:glycosyltransferase involved in cell wall biosynthesis